MNRMIICGHIIAKEQLAGIGPLIINQSPDRAMRSLYNSKQLWFYLHLKCHSIKIESNWLEVGTAKEPSDEEKKAREECSMLKNEYEKIRRSFLEPLQMNPKT